MQHHRRRGHLDPRVEPEPDERDRSGEQAEGDRDQAFENVVADGELLKSNGTARGRTGDIGQRSLAAHRMCSVAVP
jgi:hypothetical protein